MVHTAHSSKYFRCIPSSTVHDDSVTSPTQEVVSWNVSQGTLTRVHPLRYYKVLLVPGLQSHRLVSVRVFPGLSLCPMHRIGKAQKELSQGGERLSWTY